LGCGEVIISGAVRKLTQAILAGILVLLLTEQTQAVLTPPRRIVVIVMENREYSSILGAASAPYINSLANTYALATNYYANEHPSLPDYFHIVAGSNMGIHDDGENYVLTGPFLGKQLKNAGYANAAYAESLPAIANSQRPCTFPSSGLYRKKHEPYAYWDWIQGVNGKTQHCSMVQPYTKFDPANLKGFSLITPNMCNDMHDCSISTGDNWLKANIPPILAHMARKDFLVLTWDEGTTNAFGGGHVVTIFAGPGAKKNFKDATFYTHHSLLRTIENIFGVACLRGACNTTAMSNMLL
jgi:hypothetical protein